MIRHDDDRALARRVRAALSGGDEATCAAAWRQAVDATYRRSSVCLLTVDTRLRLIGLNDAALAALGTEAPPRGTPLAELIGDPDAPCLEALRHVIVEGEALRDVEASTGVCSALHPTRERTRQTSYLPVWGPNGQVIAVNIATRDVGRSAQVEAALRASEARFRLLVESVRDHAIFMLDAGGHIATWNAGAERIKGYRAAQIIGRHVSTFYPEADVAARKPERELEIAEAEGRVEDEGWRVRVDGSTFWASVVITALRDPNGALVGFAKITRDLTERKRAEDAIESSQARYRALVETAVDAIVTTDDRGRILYVNHGAEEVFGRLRAEMLGAPLDDFVPGLISHLRREAGDPLARQEPLDFLGRGAGGRVPLKVSVGHFRQDDRHHLTFIMRDVTERHEMMDTLEHLAYHDSLTGLPNRALLHDRLERAMAHADRSGRSMAVLFLDFDNFKVINDSLSHEFGDQLLKGVAARLRESVRTEDTVARLGGDEFVVVLDGLAGDTDPGELVGALLDRLAAPYRIRGHELRLTASIGVVLYPDDAADADELLRRADLAMYHAKEEKGTFRFFTRALNDRALERLELEGALRSALELDEIVAHFQPRIDLRSGRIVGAEALARWLPSEGGSVPPSSFIPIAEETGLIHELGAAMLRQACLHAAAWRREGHGALRVSVNLSSHQLRRSDLVDTVEAALAESGLPPACLEIEVTESAAMQSAGGPPVLAALRGRGVRVAVDDFGTGYSSLAYLKRLPLDTLKIDRSFLDDLDRPGGEVTGAIVRAVIALGRSLRLTVVAEGVERVEQRSLLTALGCDEGQGFLFSGAVPADAFTRLLREGASYRSARSARSLEVDGAP